MFDLSRPLSSLYLIYGDEDLLRFESLDALRETAKNQGFAMREAFFVDSKTDWTEILAAVESQGLFSDKKLLEIHIPTGKPGVAGGNALIDLAGKLNDDTTVVIFLPKLEKAQTQAKWFATLAKAAQVFEAKAVSAADLPQWIRHRLSAHKLQIDEDALLLFAERVEGNLMAANQEIEKLALLHQAGAVVSLEDAQNAVANVARFDVFQLSNAWLSGDVPRVVRLMDALEAEGEEPILLLWSVSEDIRTLLRLHAALKQGQSIMQVRNPLRLWGEKQTLAPLALKRIGVRRLMNALQTCAVADQQIKGVAQGKAWATTRQMLIELAGKSRVQAA
ncbi:MAG: DNA polymerase III subunit delta [Neisseriaceae bacterium]|nr:DNA polymerase III subunit delta [Neisseriaceae bacterium]